MLHAHGLDANFFGLHCVMCLSNRQGSPCPFQWKALPQLLAACVGRASALGRVGVMASFLVQNREPFWGSFSGPFFGPCKKGTYCKSRVSLTFFLGQNMTPKTLFRTGAICRLTLEPNLDSVRDEKILCSLLFWPARRFVERALARQRWPTRSLCLCEASASASCVWPLSGPVASFPYAILRFVSNKNKEALVCR